MVILTEDTNDLLYQKLYLSPGILLPLVSHYLCFYMYHRLKDGMESELLDGIRIGCFKEGNVFQDNLKVGSGRLALVL